MRLMMIEGRDQERMSPTARTLDLLRREGYLPAVVERWLPGVNVRKDLWGFGDVLAVHPGARAFLIVQATTLPNIGSRLNRARALPGLAVWLNAGGLFECHGWTKRNGRWACKRVAVQAGDMNPVLVQATPRKRRRSRWQPADLFAVLQ